MMRISFLRCLRQVFKFRTKVFVVFFFGIFIGSKIGERNKPTDVSSIVEKSNSYVRYDLSVKMYDRVHLTRRTHLKYLDEYRKKVDGWIDHEIFYFIWILSQYQYDHLKILGGIGEIGVHHGKFTCYLYLMRRYEEQKLFAVDVFDNQLLNKDGSGRGQKSIFLKNVAIYAQVLEEQLALYAGSSLDLNPTFSTVKQSVQWWIDTVVGKQGVQIISVDGGHTGLLTYSDVCLASNSIIDGGLVIIDDITHPGWLGVRDGTGRFLAETSSPLIDEDLENELQQNQNQTSIDRSERIVEATKYRNEFGRKTNCSRLVPFLQCFNKLFLTTPNYYPQYIELLNNESYYIDTTTGQRYEYLRYNALRLTIGHVPIWTENFDLTRDQLTNIFLQFIEPKWVEQIETSDHHPRLTKAQLK